jgi:mono/diheme cytochrome c family protein
MRLGTRLVLAAAALASLAAFAVLAQAPRGKPTPAERTAVGAALYEKGLCNVCHGDDRKGNENAPPLLGLRANWDEERLAAYLKDPAKTRSTDPRVAALAERYATMEMPPWEAPESERRALAAWLLE